MHLLLIEDDLQLTHGLVDSLAQSGYLLDTANTGHAALLACSTHVYQLIILDLGLPDSDGIDVLKHLRQRKVASPVLILTARDSLQDRIKGLDAGSDDYLPKPFSLGELEARIRALLRRGNPSDVTLNFGKLKFDTVFRCASVGNNEISLTAKELALLELLLQRPGRIVSKSQLFESLYGCNDEINPSSVEVFISRLRRKIDEAGTGIHIRVLRGLGYRIELLNE
jgi:DNA-binding response OmpR family regulator